VLVIYFLESQTDCIYFCLNIMVILITGGTGLVGSNLIQLLLSAGHTVRNLSTRKEKNGTTFYWNPHKNEIDSEAVLGVDVIVHLAGANIMTDKWTDARKKEIIESRVNGALLLAQACKEKNQTIQHYISASGIGYYGNGKDVLLNEDHTIGNSFAAKVCGDWEQSALQFKDIAKHLSALRIGIVLSNKGGFWVEMKKLAKFNILSPLGTGKQYISWIQIDDLCQLILSITENKIASGTYNAVSSEPVTNAIMSKQIAQTYHCPTWLPNVPAFALKIVLGERSAELLNGQKASNQKLLDAGFTFKYGKLKDAITTIQ
jgi:uncharacterized protein